VYILFIILYILHLFVFDYYFLHSIDLIHPMN
jgi:hypothetical protein